MPAQLKQKCMQKSKQVRSHVIDRTQSFSQKHAQTCTPDTKASTGTEIKHTPDT
jgi:hypothetical protein